MKSIKLVLKGILLWITILIVIFTICGIDSIIDKGYDWLFGTIIINFIFISTCISFISEEEYKIISGYNLLNKVFNLEED